MYSHIYNVKVLLTNRPLTENGITCFSFLGCCDNNEECLNLFSSHPRNLIQPIPLSGKNIFLLVNLYHCNYNFKIETK